MSQEPIRPGTPNDPESLQSDAAYIALLEAALIKTDDDLEAEAGMSPRNPVEVTLYDAKHKGAVVTVHCPKEPA